MEHAELWQELAGKKAIVPRGTQCFVSWRHVEAGAVPWSDNTGHRVSCWNEPPARTDGPEGPYGIHLEAQKAEVVGPLSAMDQPWETNYNMYFDTVLFENGEYRLWYTCVPRDYEDPSDGRPRKAHGHIVCYAQSKDGIKWDKPKLGIYSYQGMPGNIVYGRELSPYGFQSGSIFVDPSAPPEARYKMFFLGVIDYSESVEAVRRKYSQRFGEAVDPKIFSVKDGRVSVKCMCAAFSMDGIHWKTAEEPAFAYPSDTLNSCFWDESRGKYVAYIRLWKNGKRVVGQSETDNFYLWREKPSVVLEASLEWAPSMDVYTNSRVNYPGSDERLMFPGVYDRFQDRRNVYMAVSEDETSWRWVPSGSVADCGTEGQWYGGDLNPGIGMVFLGDDRVALPVMASAEPHKYPRARSSSLGKPGWLVWKKGRLGCIVADQYGGFSTVAMVCSGKELSVNLDCAPRAGQLLVEVQDENENPIKGYTLAEADSICTSSLDYRVSWNGDTSLTALKGRAIRLKFVLRIVKLYSFEFV